MIFYRVIQAQGMGQMHQSYSLPATLPMQKTVSFSDEYGINHHFAVHDPVYDHVRALVENSQTAGTRPVFRFGIHHRPSVTSLPSTPSQSSFASAGSQASGTAPNIRCAAKIEFIIHHMCIIC